MRNKNLLFGAAVIIFVGAAYYAGHKMSYDEGYVDGAIFGDSSGYKRGYSKGFEKGFEKRDSIAEAEQSTKSSEQFILNRIYSEIGRPEDFIAVEGELKEKEMGGSYFASNVVNIARIKVSSKARYARYKDIIVVVSFLDKRRAKLGEQVVELGETLYPDKVITREIGYKNVPENTHHLNFKLKQAHGID